MFTPEIQKILQFTSRVGLKIIDSEHEGSGGQQHSNISWYFFGPVQKELKITYSKPFPLEGKKPQTKDHRF